MNAFVLHDTSDTNGALRWGTSATAIVAAHAALIALGMAWYTQRPPPGVTIPTIMVDMAPATASPAADADGYRAGTGDAGGRCLAAGRAAKPETVQEQLEATPPQLKPEVEAPPEQKPDPTPPKPEPAKIVPDPPKPVPDETEAGSRGSQEADGGIRRRRAPPLPPGPSGRRRRHPPSAREPARRRLRPITRSSRRICSASSNTRLPRKPPASRARRACASASVAAARYCRPRLRDRRAIAALDAETLAMVRRAQPFPAFPPDMKQASMSFNVPIRSSVR